VPVANNALPPGMRDLLPPEAQFQSRVGRELMSAFGLFGYERVWLPTFEFAEVLERSRGLVGALRFIEPETGEVVALRSDMTPQIARVVATRFGSAPRPVRLCYQGSVVRRRKERARTESQVVQAGAELIGSPGAAGDLEVVELSCHAVRAAGLSDFVLDIGHAGIATRLMEAADPAARQDLKGALAAKDRAELERSGRRAGLPAATLAALVRLPDLHGGASIWPEARRQLDGTPAEAQLLELQALWQSASDAELAPVVLADLSETRELEYYTGPVFQLLAHGPGEPVASGGRYDALYRRFGAPSPAAGVALDLNHLCWALHSAGVTHPAPSRIAVASDVPRELVATLRARGLRCAASEEPRAYASHWGYDFVLERNGGLRLTHLPSNAGLDLAGDATETLAGTVAGFIDRAGSDRS
jgi:ATP phosphoribosyltransferase regulatory subunit